MHRFECLTLLTPVSHRPPKCDDAGGRKCQRGSVYSESEVSSRELLSHWTIRDRRRETWFRYRNTWMSVVLGEKQIIDTLL